jgi:hypothetical protein
MPCADIVNDMNKKNEKTELANTNHQHDDEDNCSPFCACSCCASVSINHFITAIIPLPPNSVTPVSSFLPLNIAKVVLPVWQPPQLV